MDEALLISSKVPWEKERWRRVVHALEAGEFHRSQEPLWQANANAAGPANESADARLARRMGLPLPEGPTAALDAAQWGRLLANTLSAAQVGWLWQSNIRAGYTDRSLHGVQTATAASLFQMDHGSPPEKLDDLVPLYLPRLPEDPFTGKPFGYRTFREDFQPAGLAAGLVAVPGQRLIISEDTRPYGAVVFPVPVFVKQ